MWGLFQNRTEISRWSCFSHVSGVRAAFKNKSTVLTSQSKSKLHMAREILVPSRSGSRVKNAEALFCAQWRGTKHMAWNCPRQFRPGVEKVGFLTSPEFNPTTVWHTNTRHLWVTVVPSWLTVSRAFVSMRFFKRLKRTLIDFWIAKEEPEWLREWGFSPY